MSRYVFFFFLNVCSHTHWPRVFSYTSFKNIGTFVSLKFSKFNGDWPDLNIVLYKIIIHFTIIFIIHKPCRQPDMIFLSAVHDYLNDRNVRVPTAPNFGSGNSDAPVSHYLPNFGAPFSVCVLWWICDCNVLWWICPAIDGRWRKSGYWVYRGLLCTLVRKSETASIHPLPPLKYGIVEFKPLRYAPE